MEWPTGCGSVNPTLMSPEGQAKNLVVVQSTRLISCPCWSPEVSSKLAKECLSRIDEPARVSEGRQAESFLPCTWMCIVT